MCLLDYLNVVLRLTKLGRVTRLFPPRFAFLIFWGLDLVDVFFLREKGDYGYNESVRSDGVIAAWKADNSSIYTHFQGIGCACLGLSDKDF